MNSKYRKPSIHVAGMTSVLLKGALGFKMDILFRLLPF